MPKIKKGDTYSGRTPTAVQLPSGNWRCRVQFTDADGEVHKNAFTESRPEIAEAKAIAWKAGILKEVEKKKDVTLDQAITEYLESLEASKASPSTIRDYEGRRKNSFPLIINKRLSKLTLLDIQRQLDARSQIVAPKTVHNDFALLSPILGMRREDLNLKRIRLPEIDNEEMEIPTYEEAIAVMDAAKRRKGLYCAVLLAITLGLRRSEICALEWKDIDASTGFVTIDKAMVMNKYNDWIIKKPKKKASRRKLYLEPEVIEELQRYRVDFTRVTDMNPNQVTNEFCRIRDKLGLEEIHLHSLRHYKAAIVLSLVKSTDTARRILGHRTEHMVKRVYGHITPEAKKTYNEQLSEFNVALLTRR